MRQSEASQARAEELATARTRREEHYRKGRIAFRNERWTPLPNRSSRRRRGGIRTSSTAAVFRRPSARLRVRSCPPDPTPAQRPGKARKLAEHERWVAETGDAIAQFVASTEKFRDALALHKRAESVQVGPLYRYEAPAVGGNQGAP